MVLATLYLDFFMKQVEFDHQNMGIKKRDQMMIMLQMWKSECPQFFLPFGYLK